MTVTAPSRSTGMSRHRLILGVAAALLLALDLGLKAWASRALADGTSVNLQVIQLRLTFNSGVAFGLGDTLPGGVVLGVTGLIIAGLVVFSWRAAVSAALPVRLGLVGVLAGAFGNLIDRSIDGVVTDYLHTGWFPTFNLADVFITTGGLALALGSLPTTHGNSNDPVR